MGKLRRVDGLSLACSLEPQRFQLPPANLMCWQNLALVDHKVRVYYEYDPERADCYNWPLWVLQMVPVGQPFDFSASPNVLGAIRVEEMGFDGEFVVLALAGDPIQG